jgi:hypothetical protein
MNTRTKYTASAIVLLAAVISMPTQTHAQGRKPDNDPATQNTNTSGTMGRTSTDPGSQNPTTPPYDTRYPPATSGRPQTNPPSGTVGNPSNPTNQTPGTSGVNTGNPPGASPTSGSGTTR